MNFLEIQFSFPFEEKQLPLIEEEMKKIREAQLDKVPYMVIVGQKEMDANEISVRGLDDG